MKEAIEIGQLLQAIMVTGPGGKRTGKTRPVKVLQLLCDKGKLRPGRSVLVETTDYDHRHSFYIQEWVDPKYLLPAEEVTP